MAKQFNPPSNEKAGLYIYPAGTFGATLKKDVSVDRKCIGESAPDMFFYEEVTGGEEHKVSTESEFSPNDLLIKTENGKNYFIRQYIEVGKKGPAVSRQYRQTKPLYSGITLSRFSEPLVTPQTDNLKGAQDDI